MIREAKEADLADILEIYNDAIENTTAVWHYAAHSIEDRKAWYKEKMESGYPVLVFEDNGRTIGFAAYGPFRPFPGYKYTIEHSVYVHPAAHGRGIGSSLLKELIRIAGEREYKTMVAGIDASNETSIKLHKKFGFRYAGTVEKAGYKFGRWLDLVLYQLDLPGPQKPKEG